MSERATSSHRPMRIGLLLIDGFALMSYAAFVEPLRAANRLGDAIAYEWLHIGLRDSEAAASGGARLMIDARVGETINCDLLLVFAGGDPATFRDTSCFAWLRAQARRGVPVGGVSGGPYVLARAGLLNGRSATIHWEHAVALAAEFPDLRLEQSLFVIDGDRMTCAGGTAALDLALALIERDQGRRAARRVAEWFIGPGPRRGEHTQRAGVEVRFGTKDRRLLAMLAAMDATIEEPCSREALAAHAGISLRQLERLCRRELDAGIADLYMSVRLERAMEMVRSSGFTIIELALACGFRSAAHFSRRFKQQFGTAPSAKAVRKS